MSASSNDSEAAQGHPSHYGSDMIAPKSKNARGRLTPGTKAARAKRKAAGKSKSNTSKTHSRTSKTQSARRRTALLQTDTTFCVRDEMHVLAFLHLRIGQIGFNGNTKLMTSMIQGICPEKKRRFPYDGGEDPPWWPTAVCSYEQTNLNSKGE